MSGPLQFRLPQLAKAAFLNMVLGSVLPESLRKPGVPAIWYTNQKPCEAAESHTYAGLCSGSG